MSQERWDVDLKVLNGPMASLGTQVKRGPVVRIGTNPGPTGFRLSGYRGVDARHCVITIYGEGEATIAPVGSNQVRAAPHPHVDWTKIDPVLGPEYVNTGGAIHLGPPGRGCTIEFVGSRRVGAWTGGQMASEAARVEAAAVSEHAQQEVRKVKSTSGTIRNIAVKGAPIWIMGCMTMMLVSTMSVVGGVILFRPPKTLMLDDLPIEKQREYYTQVNPEKSKLVEERLDGFNGAFQKFVAEPNAQHARDFGEREDVNDILEPSTWDADLLKYIVASFEVHARSPKVLRRFMAIRKQYSEVLHQMRDARYPDVFAAIPYLESRYQPRATSHVCALGWWQFMPEYGPRAQKYYNIDFRVENCPILRSDNSKELWTPTRSSPVVPATSSRYVGHPEDGSKNYCAIKNASYGGKGVCQVDHRTDLQKSTALAIRDFKAPWRDKELAASGAATQITILSHNAGWDASLFGVPKKGGNMKHTYRRWKKTVGKDDYHKFYGANLKCEKKDDKAECLKKSKVLPRVQHYGYPIIAQHLLAACFYGANYAEENEIFREYRDNFVGTNKYCNELKIKGKEELSR